MAQIETPQSKIVVTQSSAAVFIAVQGGVGGPAYNGDFLGIEDAEKVIAALQEAVAGAKADLERSRNMTPEERQAEINRALGLA